PVGRAVAGAHVDARARALAYAGTRRRRRGARTVRTAAGRAGPRRGPARRHRARHRHPRRRQRVSQRKLIALVLLVAALASGWAILSHRPKGNVKPNAT